MRPLLLTLVAGWLALGAAGCGADGSSASPASAIAPTAASVEKLRKANPDANRLLAGGKRRLIALLKAARGTPVVVNQWASWCGPCRYEFPFFQRLAQRYRGRVRFIGVNSRDSRAAAERFLARFPTPFEHVEDPEADAARIFKGGRAWPTTAFYTADGRLAYTHQGSYRSADDLDAQIQRYALDG